MTQPYCNWAVAYGREREFPMTQRMCGQMVVFGSTKAWSQFMGPFVVAFRNQDGQRVCVKAAAEIES